MLRAIKERLRELEQRIWAKLPFWPDDGDSFLESLGVDRGKYIVKNPDGSIGYDAIRALSDTAVRDWRTAE
ncbi:MAG: hypothetical protein IJQ42_04580 [Oscillospiraceae bacterium]|nr:hypothetical protein [Oscillospiraceae bacterium]